jgi:hypothetical protein
MKMNARAFPSVLGFRAVAWTRSADSDTLKNKKRENRQWKKTIKSRK